MKYTKAQLEGMKMKELMDVAWELGVKINPKGSKTKAVVLLWAASQNQKVDSKPESDVKQVDIPKKPEVQAVESEMTPKRGALIEYKGKSQNICAWAKELGKSPNTLYGRIYRLGWSIEKAFES